MLGNTFLETGKKKKYFSSLLGILKNNNESLLVKRVSLFFKAKPTKLEILKIFSLIGFCFQRKPELLSARKERPLLVVKKGSVSGCLVVLKKKETYEFLLFFRRIFSLVSSSRVFSVDILGLNVFSKHFSS